jgi:hypothetical protein
VGVTPIYNIPFAEPTNLVRDWPALSEDVADAVEAAVAGVPVIAGIGDNWAFVEGSDFSTSSSSFQATGTTVSITPTKASSRVLVLSSGDIDADGSSNSELQVAATAGSSPFGLVKFTAGGAAAIMFVHHPDTTSAVTYELEMRRVDVNQVRTIRQPRLFVVELQQ